MKETEKYDHYSLEDFLADEYFQDWIISPDDDSDAFWTNWLATHPSLAETAILAKRILEGLEFKENRPAYGQSLASLENAWARIDGVERQKRRNVVSLSWKIAAAFIPLAGLGMLFFWLTRSPELKNVAVPYGKMSRLQMPDNSLVILNANSSVEYKNKWDKSAPREIWLKGEAFFKVNHLDKDKRIEPYERFLVHTQHVIVEVLGTSFNIRERRGQTEISLQEGSIRVSFTDGKRAPVMLKPGDILKVDSLTNVNVTNSVVDATNTSSWSAHKLMLNNPTLGEIVMYLEDIYGKRMVFEDPKLALSRLNGPILLDSFEDALFIISTALNISFTNDGDVVSIKRK